MFVCVYPSRTREEESHQTDVAHMSSVVNLLLSSEVNPDFMQFKYFKAACNRKTQQREREGGGGEAGGESGERNGSKGGRRGGKLKKGKDGEETEKETKIIMQQKTSTCRDVKSNVTAERERVQIFLHVSYHCVIFIGNNVLIQSQLLSTTEAQCCHY